MNRNALLVAVLAALTGFAMLALYMRRFEDEALGGEPVYVIAAAQDIPLGTLLTADMLTTTGIPQKYLEERHITEEHRERLLGTRVSSSVKATEAVLWTDLAKGGVGQRRIEDYLQPGTRGVTVPIDRGAALVISPGQRIDLSYMKAVAGEMQNMVLMQNLIVIAVGGQTADGAKGSPMITVAVDPRQASALVLAAQTGILTATLRNDIDFDAPDNPPFKESGLVEIEQVRLLYRRGPAAPTRAPLPGRIE